MSPVVALIVKCGYHKSVTTKKCNYCTKGRCADKSRTSGSATLQHGISEYSVLALFCISVNPVCTFTSR